MTARTPPPLSESDRPDVLQSLRVGCSLKDAAAGYRRTADDVLADAAANGWRSDLDAAIAEGRKPTAADWSKTILASQKAEAERAPIVIAPPVTRSRKSSEHTDPDGKDGPNFEAMRDEAGDAYGPGMMGLLLLQDDRLVSRGFVPMSDWWKWSAGEFLAKVEQEEKRWYNVLAGRGMGKSTTLTRLASLGGLWCRRNIPPNQRWVWPFISVRPTDADRRIEEIGGIFDAGYGIKAPQSSPRGVLTLTLNDALRQPIAYNSFASTIGNVKGANMIGLILDEEAAMMKDGSNPSGEILASVIGAFRARKGIFGIRCSSAWEKSGSHWNAIQAGDTITNYVARIGPGFLKAAVAGFVEVAAWERARGDDAVADRLLTYAETITADTRGIPTFVGHPAIGAVASRIDIEALDDKTLGELYPGLTRSGAWMREIGSVPPEPRGSKGARDPNARGISCGTSRHGGARRRERRQRGGRMTED